MYFCRFAVYNRGMDKNGGSGMRKRLIILALVLVSWPVALACQADDSYISYTSYGEDGVQTVYTRYKEMTKEGRNIGGQNMMRAWRRDSK